MLPSAHRVRFHHSLYLKLAAIFLSGMVVTALIQFWLSLGAFRSFVSEINQSLEWDVAAAIANEIQPRLLENFEASEFLNLVYPYSIANPKLEFYLLTDEGKVVAQYAPSHSTVGGRVDLGPIQEALKDYLPELPLYGDDPGPLRENRRFYKFGTEGSIFSVAPIRFNGDNGYLYLIVEGAPFGVRIRKIGQFFLGRMFTWGWLVSLLSTAALAYLLFRLLTRRFREITNVVQQFEAGDYANSVRVDSSDEIGVLSAALNSMAQKLVKAKLEIEARDRKRRELIALITHDIRSPLAATQGYLDLALQSVDTESSPTLGRDLKLAAGSARFQAHLVDDLFELSKLEAREREPNIDVVDLRDLCAKIVDQFRFSAEPRGVRLQLDERVTGSGSFAYALGDEALLRRVMNNLVENALRFTPDRGEVTVRLEYAEESVRVSVCDSGPGIVAGTEDNIIRMFEQAESPVNRAHTGAGLGLAIVRRILELHEADLEIKSGVDAGSSFSFSLALEAD